MKIKTSELTDAALDWAAAKCEGRLPASYDDWKQTWPHYSTDWAQGGPLLEREHIVVSPALVVGTSETGRDVCQVVGWKASKDYNAHLCRYRFEANGPTPLIAAMRCFVTSKLGDEAEVPEELK